MPPGVERSQLGGSLGLEGLDVIVQGVVGWVPGVEFAGAAELGIGAVPGAFESGDLTLGAGEQFGGG
jgi:hypothetical protein